MCWFRGIRVRFAVGLQGTPALQTGAPGSCLARVGGTFNDTRQPVALTAPHLSTHPTQYHTSKTQAAQVLPLPCAPDDIEAIGPKIGTVVDGQATAVLWSLLTGVYQMPGWRQMFSARYLWLLGGEVCMVLF